MFLIRNFQQSSEEIRERNTSFKRQSLPGKQGALPRRSIELRKERAGKRLADTFGKIGLTPFWSVKAIRLHDEPFILGDDEKRREDSSCDR